MSIQSQLYYSFEDYLAVLNGEVLADPSFDPAQLICRLRDLFSQH